MCGEKFASGVDKVRRTFRNLDVAYQDLVKDILTQVSKGKDSVDSDADHAYAEMNFDAFDQIGKQLDAMGYAEAERNRPARRSAGGIRSAIGIH